MAILTIGGAAMPSPSEMKVTLFEIGSGDVRSASGALVKDVTAVKRRLNLRWAHLTPPELGNLLDAVCGVFFEAEYPDPVQGAVRTAVFHAGDCAAGILKMENGAPVWTDVSMEWIER